MSVITAVSFTVTAFGRTPEVPQLSHIEEIMLAVLVYFLGYFNEFVLRIGGIYDLSPLRCVMERELYFVQLVIFCVFSLVKRLDFGAAPSSVASQAAQSPQGVVKILL